MHFNGNMFWFLIVCMFVDCLHSTQVKREKKILQRGKRISTFEDEGIKCLMCVWTAQEPCVYEVVTCSRGEVCGQVIVEGNKRYNGCLHQSLCSLTHGKCCQDPLCNWKF
ncbi:hypothetical protein LOTGIDRAFT_152066 [Lottia gigantea]|uniref:Uncharacterized protein n=1 Tax=Lottia gigantea TaxID=225164 RepID=V4CRU8_LOTGI|nr:hypothetical protein LOTGIDRAFT_152066 [Lottia gigantea]ESP05250.1 hypothetical protein LOTGIDRAFT_152066 [Lottia gigantea]